MKLRLSRSPLSAVVLAAPLALALASCGKGEPSSAGVPAEMRVLTESQYRQAIGDVFGSDIVVGGRFDPVDRDDGLLAVGASNAAITPSAYEQFDARARAIAAQVVDANHRDILIGCWPRSAKAADDTCARQFLSRVGRLLYRRPLQERELKVVADLADKATETVGDFYEGLTYGLAPLLESADFLFIIDRRADEKNSNEALDSYSKATRLSLLLWNTIPDDELLTAAEKGELGSRRGLEKQVDRMLASPRLKDGVRAFFSDMLGFDAYDTLSKDRVIYPAFTQNVVADSKEQTLRTLADLLVTENADYREIFTTRKTFMSGALGLIYHVPVENPDGWVPYEFPANDSHKGILTQLSFVALHSHPGRSSATLRGKAIRELLMCQKVPPPPGDVDFKLVQDTDNPQYKTARQRLEAHRSSPSCAGCHVIMDPMGLALEDFDGAGQYRTSENGAAIVTADKIDGVDVTDAAGLGQVLAANPAVPACLVSRVYQYASGHTPAKGEKDYMAYLEQSFAKDGYKLPSLLRAIATSDTFYAVTAVPDAGGAKSALNTVHP